MSGVLLLTACTSSADNQASATEPTADTAAEAIGIDEADLVYGINEWDNFAVEEAVLLREKHGGKVTVMTVGDEESEDVLRRALAMGADEALHLHDPALAGSDSLATAMILHKAILSRQFDLVLTEGLRVAETLRAAQ